MDRVPASRRRRTIHAWVVAAACLLANQLALVAPVRAMTAPMPGCDMVMSMPMRAPAGARALVALSCASHCAAQAAVSNPPQAAPAPSGQWIVRTAVPAAVPLPRRFHRFDDPSGSPRAPPRPHALLFCSLLI